MTATPPCPYVSMLCFGVLKNCLQFLYSYSGLFPHLLFALKCLCYSIVAIHPELLHRNYFSYSETVPDKITPPCLATARRQSTNDEYWLRFNKPENSSSTHREN